MGFFTKMYNWFKSFFSQVAQTLLGVAAESIKDTALEVVNDLEKRPNLSGKDKYKKAESILREKYPDIESAAINLAIEAAVAIIKDRLE